MFNRKHRQQEAEVSARLFGLIEGLREVVGDMFVHMQEQDRRLKAIEELLAVSQAWAKDADAERPLQ